MELLVVLAVMALCVSLAPALLGPSRDKVAARSAARTIAADLRAARGQAVAEDRDVVLTVDVAALTVVDGSGETQRLPPALTLKFTGPQALIDGQKGSIRFFSDGSSTGGSIAVATAGENHLVAVHWLTGRVSLDD